MSYLLSRVTFVPPRPDRVPDWAAGGVISLLALESRDALRGLAERTLIRREGGYCGFDVVLFLVYFFASGLSCGLKPFAERLAPYSRQLGAVASRRRLPSQAAVSRALTAVEAEQTAKLTPWALIEAAGIIDVVRSPWAQTSDALGRRWHLFDLDGSVTVLRQRGLPMGDDLPEPHRRAEEFAPGYTGRKRGDIQLRRSLLQHAGSACWVDGRLSPGNGCRRSELPATLRALRDFCDTAGIPLSDTLVRADGEYGSVPAMTDFRAAGVPFCAFRSS